MYATHCAGTRTTEIKTPTLWMKEKPSGRLGNLLKVTRLVTGRAELWFYFFGTNIYIHIYFYKTTLTLNKK